MSMSFTKLFSSITDSSIWCEDSDTKVVWVTMLAMADEFGRVMSSVPGLAKRANVSLQQTEIALTKFLSADPHSRTKDHEGRRIEVYEGGWRLLNHQFYRDIRHDEDRKEQNRQAQQRRRERLKCQQTVSNGQQMSSQSAHADADADADAESKKEEGPATLTFSDLQLGDLVKSKEFADEVERWMAFRTKLKKPKTGDWKSFFKGQIGLSLRKYGENPTMLAMEQSRIEQWQGIFANKFVGKAGQTQRDSPI